MIEEGHGGPHQWMMAYFDDIARNTLAHVSRWRAAAAAARKPKNGSSSSSTRAWSSSYHARRRDSEEREGERDQTVESKCGYSAIFYIQDNPIN
jgi:hypothetical protein